MVHKIIGLTTEIICLQGELLIILITTMNIETLMKETTSSPVDPLIERRRRKGLNCAEDEVTREEHVDKDIWTPKLDKRLEVIIEPGNPKDKFAECLEVKTLWEI